MLPVDQRRSQFFSYVKRTERSVFEKYVRTYFLCFSSLDKMSLGTLRHDLSTLNEKIEINVVISCPLCTKTYTTHNWCKKHLKKVHN
jgi:hypothetical protein